MPPFQTVCGVVCFTIRVTKRINNNWKSWKTQQVYHLQKTWQWGTDLKNTFQGKLVHKLDIFSIYVKETETKSKVQTFQSHNLKVCAWSVHTVMFLVDSINAANAANIPPTHRNYIVACIKDHSKKWNTHMQHTQVWKRKSLTMSSSSDSWLGILLVLISHLMKILVQELNARKHEAQTSNNCRSSHK